jgi:hypothetical protein
VPLRGQGWLPRLALVTFLQPKILANATLAQRFRAVAGEDPSAHRMIIDALEKPAGEEQIHYDQASAPPKEGCRDRASGDHRS